MLQRDGAATSLPECTMTFAYWNPDIRTQRRLLNPQTGEYLDVSVEPLGKAALDGRDAEHFVIRGRDLEIELWYTAGDDRWLALQSRNARGGLVAYRTSADPGATEARETE